MSLVCMWILLQDKFWEAFIIQMRIEMFLCFWLKSLIDSLNIGMNYLHTVLYCTDSCHVIKSRIVIAGYIFFFVSNSLVNNSGHSISLFKFFCLLLVVTRFMHIFCRLHVMLILFLSRQSLSWLNWTLNYVYLGSETSFNHIWEISWFYNQNIILQPLGSVIMCLPADEQVLVSIPWPLKILLLYLFRGKFYVEIRWVT